MSSQSEDQAARWQEKLDAVRPGGRSHTDAERRADRDPASDIPAHGRRARERTTDPERTRLDAVARNILAEAHRRSQRRTGSTSTLDATIEPGPPIVERIDLDEIADQAQIVAANNPTSSDPHVLATLIRDLAYAITELVLDA